MAPSRLDAVYRSILLTKFFTKGWGNPDSLRRIFEFRKIVANREACYNLIPRDYPINITKDEEWSDCHIVEGCFESPFEHNLPNIMPEETKTCYFQLILPLHWSSQKIKPVCLHLAGTGDHYFWRRRNLIAKPLLKEAGIASLLLENPFYGMRKPKDQIRSNLHNVADIFIMGGCLIMESIVLLNWCEQRGFGPLGLTGLSMGGHDAFLAGQHFVKHYPASLKRMNEAREQSHNPEVDKSMEVGKVDEVGIENNNNMNARVDEERVAAKMFPLNLIYERFKSNEPDKLEEVCMLPASKDPLRLDSKYREREAFQFMRGVMDECTHLRNFEVPVDTSLIIAICAKDDAYVPREGCMSLEEIWPGAEIRYIDAGHVTGYLLHQKFFRSMIAEAFGRSLKKYPIDERS
ncbi:protein ABHD18 isoform X3 [Venturia canescens]|uniref:protein ABHD18 isoform X3 n=1 Tax=Venturia canescens TaxID=32260 RepID=UPI001C9D04CF|nr:protein ABHD18 isoform X3 [Venturia canescens]